jgi:hypothetical protein
MDRASDYGYLLRELPKSMMTWAIPLSFLHESGAAHLALFSSLFSLSRQFIGLLNTYLTPNTKGLLAGLRAGETD